MKLRMIKVYDELNQEIEGIYENFFYDPEPSIVKTISDAPIIKSYNVKVNKNNNNKVEFVFVSKRVFGI